MPPARSLSSIVATVLSAWLSWTSPASAQDDTALKMRGHALLATNCSRCHAIEPTGSSNHPEAPPFRTLSRKYPVEWLAEALAEGLSTGHPDMPEFKFEIEDVDAILAYLQSIQSPKSAPTPK
jgi:mono/diheme cytochrome c family protein